MPPFFALFAAAEGTGCIRDCMIGKSSESGKCFSHLFVLKIIARKVYFIFHIPACNGSGFSLTQKNGAESAPFFCAYSFPGPFPSSDVDGEGEGVAEGLGEGTGVVDGEGEGTGSRGYRSCIRRLAVDESIQIGNQLIERCNLGACQPRSVILHK